MVKVLSRIIQGFRNASLHLCSVIRNFQNAIELDIPYVSQFATPEWAEKILKDGESKNSDPDWQTQGATSAEEYADWVTTTCGMACTSMILSYTNRPQHGVITLAKDALQAGVYTQESGAYTAMRYKEFCIWIRKYGLLAAPYTCLSVRGIQYLISNDHFVVASVNPNIRGYETAPRNQKGGHLVLVTGYNIKNNTISIHNPSGFVSDNSQKNHTIPTDTFVTYFAARGIALKPRS